MATLALGALLLVSGVTCGVDARNPAKDALQKVVSWMGRGSGFVEKGHTEKTTEKTTDWPSEYMEFEGLVDSHTTTPPSHEWVKVEELPDAFTWGNINGESFLTRNLNQHVPQYCGSCWAHAALSALADRVKIARGNTKADIGFSIQYLLNCGAKIAGSCHGGSAVGTYYFIKSNGFVPFDTCLAYESCSSDSTEGACADPGRDYSCTAANTCRTCSTFAERGGFCSEVDYFPNASVADYGRLIGEAAMRAEIFARGPISCSLNAQPLHSYQGGIFDDDDAEKHTNHLVSIVGWGVEPAGDDGAEGRPYWIGRNSWGEYWGELGFFRIARGRNTVGVEQNCAWVTPGGWTEANVPCFEDGTNCGPGGAGGGVGRAHYADPGRARVPAGRLAAERRGGGGGAVAGKKVGATTLLVMAEGEQKEAEAALGVDDGSVL